VASTSPFRFSCQQQQNSHNHHCPRTVTNRRDALRCATGDFDFVTYGSRIRNNGRPKLIDRFNW
jgi:hypothetical protein